MKRELTITSGLFALTIVAGCSTQPRGEELITAGIVMDTAENQQVIYSSNADGWWSASAWQPSAPGAGYLEGGATFTGPTGKTRKMGVCLLQQVDAYASCTTVADCSNQPSDGELPAGGTRYCVDPNGSGVKTCHYRPGPATSYCAGSPALGGVAVAPGSFYAYAYYPPPASRWISYGCFEGCAANDPSSSSTTHYVSAGCGDGICDVGAGECNPSCPQDCAPGIYCE